MSRKTRAFAILCATFAAAVAPADTRAGVITQTSTLDPTTTDFDSSRSNVSPLVFQKFDTMGGARVLDSVSISLTADVTNKFTMTFVNPATITETLSSGNGSSSGPVVTIFQQDGKTPYLTVAEPGTPSLLSRSVVYGGGPSGKQFPVSFSSDSAAPFNIAPMVAKGATGSVTLNTPADLALFTKTAASSSLSLPLSASSFSSFSSNSGNGSGGVTSMASASATVSYTWHGAVPAPQNTGGPAPVPEPAALFLWGLGAAGLGAARRVRKRI